MPPNERFHEIDVLRFLAAAAVMLYHLAFRFWIEHASGYLAYPALAPFAKYGYLGVDLFFMVSGFVILLTALGRGPRAFVVSRATRLLPTYWFALCVTFTFVLVWPWPIPDYQSVGVTDFLVNLTMFQEFLGFPNVDGVYWTLAVELRFYLLMFVVLLCGQSKHIEWLLGGWIAACVLMDQLPHPAWLQRVLIQDWAQYFVAGAICYLIRVRGMSLYRLAVFGVCWVHALRHGYWFGLLKQHLTGVTFEPVVVFATITAFFGVFLLIAARRIPDGFQRFAFLGTLTYPLYLLHTQIGKALLSVGYPHLPPLLLLAAVCALLLGLAAATHHWIERPFTPRLRAALLRALYGRVARRAESAA